MRVARFGGSGREFATQKQLVHLGWHEQGPGGIELDGTVGASLPQNPREHPTSTRLTTPALPLSTPQPRLP